MISFLTDTFLPPVHLLSYSFAISRYKLRVKAEDGEAVVNMVFFGDVATDLIGKPPGGGRFQSTAGADPATVLAAVRRTIFQVYKEQLSSELKRLRAVLVSGSASTSEAVEAVRAASLVVGEAAAVVAEANAVLRLPDLADDNVVGWSNHNHLELHIKQSRMLMAAMERAPPESRRTIVHGLVVEMSHISGFASNWCHTPPPPPYRARRNSMSAAVVDELASGIEAVQVSAQE
ncbi:hypothetical protein ACQ4PT_040350 [Festuca glaucescens]